MRYFSVFSGVGGFELGIEKAYGQNRGLENQAGQDVRLERTRSEEGHLSGDGGVLPERDAGLSDTERPSCIGLSEIDKHASAVLKYRFPDVKNYGDITKIDWSLVPDFDLLVGGSPCQDLSIAGKRAGLEGGRSGLFYEYVRALEEKKPEHFIWENVKGALSSNGGRDFGAVLSALAEAGYSLWWQVLNAKDFGVPQNRERVFVVGTRTGSPREIFFERGDVEETAADVETKGMMVTGQPVYKEGKREMEYKTSEEAPCIRATQYKSGDNQPRLLQDARIRRLTPKECERLMSWPDDWTAFGVYENEEGTPKMVSVSDTQRYKMCGNGVVSEVVAAVVKAHLSP